MFNLKFYTMKNLIMAIIAMVFATPIFAQTATIKVSISGIENNKGVVEIGLYNSEASFPVFDKVFKGAEVKASTSGVTYVFKNVPVGTYAIATWHDEDEDKTMNNNFFGAPSEDYGFSKNIYGSFGPPDFADVSFKVQGGKVIKLTINLE